MPLQTKARCGRSTIASAASQYSYQTTLVSKTCWLLFFSQGFYLFFTRPIYEIQNLSTGPKSLFAHWVLLQCIGLFFSHLAIWAYCLWYSFRTGLGMVSSSGTVHDSPTNNHLRWRFAVDRTSMCYICLWKSFHRLLTSRLANHSYSDAAAQ